MKKLWNWLRKKVKLSYNPETFYEEKQREQRERDKYISYLNHRNYGKF